METYFELAHIGMNLNCPEEAEKIASTLSLLFDMRPREGKKSIFVGDLFECMKTPYLGSKGHIGLYTNNLSSAVSKIKSKGFSFREETASYDDAGRLCNIYLDGEFCGFAIHIMQKQLFPA
jgi:methylmalonyl-CoA/ethylmalonyl-CoA epimerase